MQSEQIRPLDTEEGISGDGISFGQSVALSLDVLAVGAPENDLAAYNSGSVYFYDIVGGETCNISMPSFNPTFPPAPSPTLQPSISSMPTNVPTVLVRLPCITNLSELRQLTFETFDLS